MSNIKNSVVHATGLSAYQAEIRRYPILSKNDEYMLAKRYVEHKDQSAAHKLVTSHLRLVAKIAFGYRGYGLPISEVISEGNVGLVQAVKKFDPERENRLSTYAMWWIRASIQDYILRTWSLVKIGTTAAQKKLFFNLRRLKGELKALGDGELRPEIVKEISERLNVSESEVKSMNVRMNGDSSLNTPIHGEDNSGEWIDWLKSDSVNQEVELGKSQEHEIRHAMLIEAMGDLNEREQEIFVARRLSEKKITLDVLSKKHGVTRERIRQIEVRAFEKVQQAMLIARDDASANDASM